MRFPETTSTEVLKCLADTFRVLSEPTRLELVFILMREGEMTVGALVYQSGRSLANVSKHLKQLAAGGVVKRRKQGLYVFYTLKNADTRKVVEMAYQTCLQEQQL